MNGKINGVEVSARGKDVPRIPDEYWHGEMTSKIIEILQWCY
jgi:hypothetical protein